MALYGGARDVSMFRRVNRELMGSIISEEVIYYKYKVSTTKTNMYGEALEKWYYPPLSIKCLLERGDQTNPDDEFGVGTSQTLTVKITKDSFQAINILPEVGDVLTDQEKYYEVKDININIITIFSNIIKIVK
jgi:hypothetical protein